MKKKDFTKQLCEEIVKGTNLIVREDDDDFYIETTPTCQCWACVSNYYDNFHNQESSGISLDIGQRVIQNQCPPAYGQRRYDMNALDPQKMREDLIQVFKEIISAEIIIADEILEKLKAVQNHL